MNILAVFKLYIFQEFGSFLRTEVDLVEDDIRLVSKENISSFFTHVLQPDVCNIKNLSEVLVFSM